jgi:hypothetical protein
MYLVLLEIQEQCVSTALVPVYQATEYLFLENPNLKIYRSVPLHFLFFPTFFLIYNINFSYSPSYVFSSKFIF